MLIRPRRRIVHDSRQPGQTAFAVARIEQVRRGPNVGMLEALDLFIPHLKAQQCLVDPVQQLGSVKTNVDQQARDLLGREILHALQPLLRETLRLPEVNAIDLPLELGGLPKTILRFQIEDDSGPIRDELKHGVRHDTDEKCSVLGGRGNRSRQQEPHHQGDRDADVQFPQHPGRQVRSQPSIREYRDDVKVRAEERPADNRGVLGQIIEILDAAKHRQSQIAGGEGSALSPRDLDPFQSIWTQDQRPEHKQEHKVDKGRPHERGDAVAALKLAQPLADVIVAQTTQEKILLDLLLERLT